MAELNSEPDERNEIAMTSGPQPGQEPDDDALDGSDIQSIRRAMVALQEGPSRDSHPSWLMELESWVNEFFVLTFNRRGEHVAWCPYWWDHPEAVFRLEALWRAWQSASNDPAGDAIARWIRDYLDPTLLVIFDRAGPFDHCGAGKHAVSPALPVEAIPADRQEVPQHWWDDIDGPER